MKILPVLLAVAVFSASTSALAQWQWLDKDGRKVFSDRAPSPEVPEKNILKRPNSAGKTATVAPNFAATEDPAVAVVAPAPTPAASPTLGAGVDKELEAKKKQLAEAELAKRKAEEEKLTKARIENCARAKQAKTGLESGVRMARTNAAGEREILDDTARAEETKRIQAVIASDCR